MSFVSQSSHGARAQYAECPLLCDLNHVKFTRCVAAADKRDYHEVLMCVL